MKQNQKKRFNNARFNNRNAQKLITRNTIFDSTGPCGKLRGTPLQLAEKYQVGAKDAMMQNDIVLAQTCMQFADHYMRLQNQAIQNEQNARQNQQHNNQNRQPKEEAKDELPVVELPQETEQETGEVAEQEVAPVIEPVVEQDVTTEEKEPKKTVLKLKKKPRAKKEEQTSEDAVSTEPAEQEAEA